MFVSYVFYVDIIILYPIACCRGAKQIKYKNCFENFVLTVKRRTYEKYTRYKLTDKRTDPRICFAAWQTKAGLNAVNITQNKNYDRQHI